MFVVKVPLLWHWRVRGPACSQEGRRLRERHPLILRSEGREEQRLLRELTDVPTAPRCRAATSAQEHTLGDDYNSGNDE
eukprot:3607129-Alexandrium_andersonii.AAC.1